MLLAAVVADLEEKAGMGMLLLAWLLGAAVEASAAKAAVRDQEAAVAAVDSLGTGRMLYMQMIHTNQAVVEVYLLMGILAKEAAAERAEIMVLELGMGIPLLALVA